MTLSIHILAATLTFAQVPSPTTPLTPKDVPHLGPTEPRAPLARRARVVNITGLSLLAVASPLWGAMLAGLTGGAKDRHDYNLVVAKANLGPRPPTAGEQDKLDGLTASGRWANRLAIGTGAAAGVLTLIAAALLGRAHILRRKARGISPLVAPRGLDLGWRVQF